MLLNFVTQNNDRSAAIFKGYAGVGKSTTLTVLVESLKRCGIPSRAIGVTAPTHKAVKVLRKDAIPDITYSTIHSMLALKETVNETTGEVSFRPDPNNKNPPPIQALRILIIDETSMLNDDIFYLVSHQIKNGLKVIFTGDPIQIPPVNNKDPKSGFVFLNCIPFRNADKPEWRFLVVELDEIIRQKSGNPILTIATEIRNNFQTGTFNPTQQINDVGEGIVLIEPGSAAENALLETKFSSTEFNNDGDYMKVIAYKNDTVKKYNERIRKMIYKGQVLHKIMLDEKLLLSKPYVISPKNILSNNEELEVMSVHVSDERFPYYDIHEGEQYKEMAVYNCTVSYEAEGEVFEEKIRIIHEESEQEFANLLLKLKNQALDAPGPFRGQMWKTYYQVMGHVAHVTYNYAITSHKSQGSSYDSCLVLKWDIDSVRPITQEERNRCLYVACTRPKKVLYISP